MTIALDATYSIGGELSGVGLYSAEMLYGLASAHPESRFGFWYRSHRYRAARRVTYPPNVRKRLLVEPIGPWRADLFHGLNQRLPRIKLRRAVTTFHDLFVISGEYSTPEFRKRFREQAMHAAARSDAVIAVSEFTRSQMIALLGADPAKVHVVHHGTRALEYREGRREQVILNVGAIQKRKNVARLVEAFESLDSTWRLVLAGAVSGYGAAEIQERIARSPAQSRILVLGYVSPEELSGWYGRASIFAFPSLDEGFGMPVLEAMAAGVPVLTSNRSALPEVAGDAALLVDPLDTGAIAAGLQELAGSEELRKDLAVRGRARARCFTWEKAVRETWAVYRQLLG